MSYSHTITFAACLYSLTLRLTACVFLHYQAHGRHSQARCLSSLTLSGSYSFTIRLTACLLSLAGLLSSILSLSLRLAAYLFPLHQARCPHSCYCLSVFTPNAVKAFLLFSSLRLAVYLVSGSLPMYSRAHCLGIHRLTAYVFSGSLLMYSQAHCLCILRLTAYVSSGSLPMYPQAHCLGIHRLTAYVSSGSLPMYSRAHCLCILRLTAYVFSGSLPMYPQAHCLCILGLTA